MNSLFKELLKFSEQQEKYLITSIRVSSVIDVGTPLKPTASKIFINSSSSIINSLNSRSVPGERNCKEINTNFALYFISTIIRGVQSCGHLNTHMKSILGVPLLHTLTITIHNFSAPHFLGLNLFKIILNGFW